jgi:hypothetical protein
VQEAASNSSNGRDETDLERCDRNLTELLQEVRVVQTGIQILFGFLLTVAFQPKFKTLTGFQRADYFGTLIAAAITLIMLTAPTSWHRILFRRGDKRHLVNIANRFTVIGMATMGFTVIGAVMLLSDIAFPTPVTVIITTITVLACSIAWYIMPLARRRSLETPTAAPERPAVLRDLGGGRGIDLSPTQPPGAA